MKKIFITTPIYYPNNNLHIGHAYTTILADTYKRYKKMQGYEVFFLTGSDEHGQKIAEKALEENKKPKEYVDKIIENFKILWKKLNIEYDFFIRTTDNYHQKYIQNTFVNLLSKNYIYKDNYKGLYCKYDETFFTKNQVLEGNVCPECKRKLIYLEEESYFLKVSIFKKWIIDKLKNTNLLSPNYFTKELINNFLNDSFLDLSITRTSIDWGIKVPNDHKHVIYVWFDALLNYLSVFKTKESKYEIEDIWSKQSEWEIIQLIGKEITRFHAIYWPIILKMKNYRLPKIIAHGWLITDQGDKMSKSKNNSIDPIKLLKKYQSDEIRFYLLNNIKLGDDGKFSEKLLIKTINGILVNKYSNLVARTDNMIRKYNNGYIPKKIIETKSEKNLEREILKLENNYYKYMDNFSINDAIDQLIKYTDILNKYIEEKEPWKEKNQEYLNTILNFLINNIYKLSYLFSPFLPNSFKKVNMWLNDKDFSKKINKLDFLFKRIKD
ncbi:Methionine--tRNA ligase [Candidatus Hepatoplasma crinochetorum Av]|uniref:Methionine--tRNA ligase n=1 Tax=Candidatus Hepatoplasma crinochetorum Av TaxID=1427984 RepID=W8GGF0_9MOLU|nr:methionine--tRNA ligase [Candidatus Hepatoplasma crinochetorum]AHK22683.1 Methionine--tRNA ligase [Candidatus Hepatoplasma crinochetorum Av]